MWRVLAAACAAGPLLVSACAGGAAVPVPAPAAVVYYRDPADPSLAIVAGWDGKVRGRLPLPAGATSWQQSPDGAYLLVPTGAGDTSRVMSPEGRVVLTVASGATWADDSRHLCVIADVSGRFPGGVVTATGPNTTSTGFPPAHVFIDSVDGASRRVATAPRFSPVSDSRAYCSIRRDRVVVVSSSLGLAQVAGVLDLSNGHRLRFDAAGSAMVAVSPDAAYIAESNQSGTATTVRDVATGRVVGRVGEGQVRAISASGRLAVRQHPGTVGPPASLSASPSVDVVELASGRILWVANGSLADLVVEPDGSRFLVGARPAGTDLEDVWLVHADGTAAGLARRVRPATG